MTNCGSLTAINVAVLYYISATNFRPVYFKSPKYFSPLAICLLMNKYVYRPRFSFGFCRASQTSIANTISAFGNSVRAIIFARLVSQDLAGRPYCSERYLAKSALAPRGASLRSTDLIHLSKQGVVRFILGGLARRIISARPFSATQNSQSRSIS
jgi:hypothetical protein